MGIRHPFLLVYGGWVKSLIREEAPSLLYQTVEVPYYHFTNFTKHGK